MFHVVIFKARTFNAEPIAGVLFRIFDSERTFVTQGVTNTQGAAEFSLPDGDYILHTYQKGFTGPSPRSFTLDDTLSGEVVYPIHLDRYTVPVGMPSDERLCRVYCRFTDLSGDPIPGRQFRVSPELQDTLTESPVVSEDSVVLTNSATAVATSDDSGYCWADLYRGATLVASFGREALPFIVPDSYTANIVDLVYRVPRSIEATFDPGEPVVVGDVSSVEFMIELTDGQIVPAEDIPSRFDCTSSDEKVLMVKWESSGTLQVTACTTGTATIKITPKTPPYRRRTSPLMSWSRTISI